MKKLLVLLLLVSCGKIEINIPKPKLANTQIIVAAAPADSSWNWPTNNTPICYYPGYSNPIVLFFDFDGYQVNSLLWNGGNPFYAVPSNLTALYIAKIISIIKDHYVPFNVLVTSDSAFFYNGVEGRRQRIVITDTYEWMGNVSGIAFIGTVGAANNNFTSDEAPSFVFPPKLNYDIKKIAETCTHEAGHAFGLNHQATFDSLCNLITEYNEGTDSIAPIMGNSQGKIGKWWIGPVKYGCDLIQNDSLIISNNSQ